MTEIESESIQIARSASNVYAFLNDLRNYSKLIDQEVGTVTAEEKSAKLDVKGLGKFELRIEESKENEYIRLIPSGKLPFSFHIEWHITPSGDHCAVKGRINAKLNPFIRMMAEPKLRSFVENQGHRLKTYLENEIE